MNKYLTITIAIVVVIGATFFFVTRGNDESIDSARSDFDVFRESSLIDYEGNDVSLEKFQGTPLVINSWAVWCPFCREELSDFAELQKEFSQKIVVIAIDRQEPVEKAKSYTDELGITEDMLFFLDPSDSFYKSIGGFSMPETIFVNSTGEIVVHKRGPMELEEMREHVNKIIE